MSGKYYNQEVNSKSRKKHLLQIVRRGWIRFSNSNIAKIGLIVLVVCEVLYLKNLYLSYNESIIMGDLLRTLNLIAFSLLFIVIDIMYFFLLGSPFMLGRIANSLMRGGIYNAMDEPPLLLTKEKINYKEYGSSQKLVFLSDGVPISVWRDRKEYIESALNCYVIDIKQGVTNNKVEMIVAPSNSILDEYIEWDDAFIPKDPAEYVLGKAIPDRLISYNVDKLPHMICGASTGAGKTNIIKTQIRQAILRGTKVYLLDKKRLVDYGEWYRKKCIIAIDNEEILECTTHLVEEMNSRFNTLSRYDNVNNIKELLDNTNEKMDRILIVVDEVAQVTDTTGLSRDEKRVIEEIASNLTRISQLGRACGMTLVVGAQRPDMTIPGQLRSNFNIKVGGRCDDNLSRIIFGDDRGSDEIPKNILGRFMLGDDTHTQFQAFFIKI